MRFKIADLVLELNHSQLIKVTDAFLPFLSEESDDYKICFQETGQIAGSYDSPVIYHGDCFDIPVKKDQERRFFFELGNPDTYYASGVYDWGKREICIQYTEEGKKHFSESGNAFFHIGFERLLLEEGRMILHSCLVRSEFGGILFSGNSGIGKSTQGNLWELFEGAEVLNGDRSILRENQGSWFAYGSPYAGSSRVYKNEAVSVRCIVMLQQAKECRIRRLRGMEAFHKVFAQITVNTWDSAYVDRTLDMVEKLVTSVPVFELNCTPDENAIYILKQELKALT